jgi:hypothetical protein
MVLMLVPLAYLMEQLILQLREVLIPFVVWTRQFSATSCDISVAAAGAYTLTINDGVCTAVHIKLYLTSPAVNHPGRHRTYRCFVFCLFDWCY